MKSILILTVVTALFMLGGCGQDTPSGEAARQSQSVQQPEQKDVESPATATDAQNQDAETTRDDADAMTMYRQAQSLMKDGRHEEGYECAKKAMAQFIAEDNDLAWMLLESITSKDHRIDIHFNMGPSERQLPNNGIVRPLSFRVFSQGDDARILEIIDYEIGYMGGEAMTAAIGRTDDSGHANFGMLPMDASYEAIKKAVLDVVSRK